MWEELGIAPSDDPKTIRRAYATRLKRLDPDRNPEAFARLRRALEWALAEAAAGPVRSGLQLDVAQQRADPPDFRSAQASSREGEWRARPAPHQLTAHEQDPGTLREMLDGAAADGALLAALDSALARRDAAEATKLYYRAAATGALPLHAASHVLDQLCVIALEDPALDFAALRELAQSVPWDQLALRGSGASVLHYSLLWRLSAEGWYASMVATADAGEGTARCEVEVARLILGRLGRRPIPRVDRALLRTRLDEYKAHEKWLHDRIDPEWLGELDKVWRRREIGALVLYASMAAGMLGLIELAFILAPRRLPLWLIPVALIALFSLLWILGRLLGRLARVAMPPVTAFLRSAAARVLRRIRAVFGFWPKGRQDAP